MKRLLLAVAAIAAYAPLQAAPVPEIPGWVLRHPSPQPNDLLDVSFSGNLSGIAVGEAGTILVTRDGGSTWAVPELGLREQFWAVEQPEAGTAVVVGTHGAILRSPDAGETWSVVESGTEDALHALTFVDASTGFAMGEGGTLLATTDGGLSWTPRRGVGLPSGCRDIGFADANTGWVVGYSFSANLGFIRRTTDGGATWISQTAGSAGIPSRIHVFDADNVLVAGDGFLRRTTDGGITWTEVASPVLGTGDADPDNDLNIGAMVFRGRDNGYVVGRSFRHQTEVIARTSDGGETWIDRSPVGLEMGFYGNSEAGAVAFGDPDHVTFVRGQGDILRSTDGGVSWERQFRNAFGVGGADLTGVHFADADTGAVVATSGVARTTDGGSTWVRQGIELGEREVLLGVHLLDTDIGILVGGDYSVLSGTVFRTSDGGASWVRRVVSGLPLRGLSFTGPTHGVVVGDGGFIATSADAGATWTTRSSIASQQALYGVAFADASLGIAVGGSSNGSRTIRRTSDGGASWLPGTLPGGLGSPGGIVLDAVAFPVPGLAVAVGAAQGRQLIIRSTDAGATWSTMRVGVDGQLHGVHFSDALRGTAVGERNLARPDRPPLRLGSIYRTEDGGQTWTLQDCPGVPYLTDVFFSDAQVGWAAGAVGVVLGTTSAGNPVSAPAGPQLSMALENGEVVLSWPASFVGFGPQWSTGLGSPATWSPVTGEPVAVGDRWEYREPANEIPARVYRLFRP